MAVNSELRAQLGAIGQYYTSWNNEYLKLNALTEEQRSDPSTLNRLNDLSRQVGSMQSQVASIGQKNIDAGPENYDAELNAAVIQDTALLNTLQANIYNVRAGYNLDATPAPVPPADPNSEKPLTGPADEDNGQGQANTAASGATPSPKLIDSVTVRPDPETTDPFPGKRLKNPLGYFSSYTYQISLYMVTPDAYEAFIYSGRRNIEALNQVTEGEEGVGGAFLVAQSGGINNTTSKRAPGFDFDYGIDNLRITTIMNGKTTQASFNTTEIQFTVTEPYGFSFLTKLRDATSAMLEYGNQIGASPNPTKQFFILGIRFFGYDEAGNLMTGKETYDNNTLDPYTTGNGLFQQFYDIHLKGIKFKLDGKATEYHVSAISTASQGGFSTKNGHINSIKQVTGSTVGEAVDDLMKKLNAEQKAQVDAGSRQYPTTYSVVYLDEEAKEIQNASIVTPEDLDKAKFPGSGAETTGQSVDAYSVTATPNTTKRTITFNNDEPISRAIENIIAQSTYLRDALKQVFTTALEPAKTGGLENNKPNTKKEIQWYHASAEIAKAEWDTKRGEWSYHIKYIIQTYKTPTIDSAYANPSSPYYGPHKRYEYWYTGKNAEVLGYEQNLDNTYYNVTLTSPPSIAAANFINEATGSTGEFAPPQVPGKRPNMPRLSKTGNGLDAQNNYMTSLYDPGAYATAKITIMGDPDFLMQDQTASEFALYNRFYGADGFTISPNGGFVYIEIDFKEAVDYDSEKGFMRINDKILFWKYPDEISRRVTGVIYKVIGCVSVFVGGTFKQMLNCTVEYAGITRPGGEEYGAGSSELASNSGPAPGNSNATTGQTGLRVDTIVPDYIPKPGQFDPNFRFYKVPPTATNTVPTKTGTVADDDGGG